MKHIVSFSGGKDSTAMLFKMIELEMPIDEIVFCDTGLEFPEIYNHIWKVKETLPKEIEFVTLKGDYTFDFLLNDYIQTKGKHKGDAGKGYPRMNARWCTYELKVKPFKRYFKDLKNYIEYHGIAFDEPNRINKNKDRNIKYPLYDLEITEKQALQYCYDLGFYFGGVYEKYDRASCWCCPLQSLKDLRILYNDFKELWEKLEEMDKKTSSSFRGDYSLEQLKKRFESENRRLKLW